ncbi:GNAT family N-acetyltransferase [Geitlerinema sp. PCC 9228]|uniref:GNAT family N-acetyltransferase n=1 Tax=Geitlerinema sp. PCC 9228 TaxID=111611 RepID=UPI0008F9E1FC|nr:GNAT family N-acetyltransferase [Geitlerinema sp. PCC 9228]
MLELRELTDTSHADWEAVLQIYETAFPADERFSSERMRKRVQNRQDRLFVGYLDEKVVFMALTSPLSGTEFVLLGYLATHQDFRGRGIGSQFLRQIVATIHQQSRRYLLLEVETPDAGNDVLKSPLSPTERQQRQRRIQFYRRLGAVELAGVRYFVPGLSGGEPTEMKLMVLPKYHQNAIAGEKARYLVTRLFVHGYRQSKRDRLYQIMMDSIGNTVDLI